MPRGDFCARHRSELGHDIGDVTLRRTFSDRQASGDLAIC
jgi:hypothetical protein